MIQTYPEHNAKEVEAIVQGVTASSHEWRRTPLPARARVLTNAAALLRTQATDYATLMAREMGKPLAQGRAEAEKCAWVCDYYAEHAERFLAPEPVATDASRSYVAFEPLGVVLAVMPWNFPFWQVFRAAAPTLMAGNGLLLKHASNVSGCALAIEDLLRQAGAPHDLCRALLIAAGRVLALIEHPLVHAVTLTGSTRAGRAVAAAAGAALKKTVLELGGSDPYLILEDADLDAAAETCAASRMINAGQSCIAAKRFIVQGRAIHERFEARLVERMSAYRLGDPLEEGVTVGPLARHDLRDQLHRQQVDASVRAGAQVALGATIPVSPGAYYPPTVLTHVTPGMPVFDEETFGPVAAVIRVEEVADAVRLANASPYGLGAAVFTADPVRGERIAAEQLQAGFCCVNTSVRSDPRLPFGGIKASGYGRELSRFGIREFVNIKTIYCR